MHEAAGRSPEGAGDVTPAAPAPAANGERILLLECRLEQLRSALDEARADADNARGKLAEAAAREADHARRYALIHQELAEARADLASLHERLDRSEALRAELEGHLFEAGARGDAAELVRLRREVLAQRQRSSINERTCARLRARVDELLLSRETLLTRVAEWQRLIQKEGPAAADLAEFMAELRGDILHLEHRNAAGERQAAALRDRLVRAGLDPDEPAAEEVPIALFEALDGASTPEFLPLDGDVVATAAAGDDRPPAARTAATPEAATPEREKKEIEERPAAKIGPWRVEKKEVGEVEKETAAAVEPGKSEQIEAANLFDEAADEAKATDSTTVPPRAETQAANRTDARAEASTASRADTAPPARAREEQTDDAAAPPVEGLHAPDPSVRAAAYERLTRLLEGDPKRLAYHLRPGLADPHPRVRRRAVLAAATAQRLPLYPLLEPLQGDPDPHVRRVVREVLRHVSRAQVEAENDDDVVLASARAVPETRS